MVEKLKLRKCSHQRRLLGKSGFVWSASVLPLIHASSIKWTLVLDDKTATQDNVG